MIYVSINNKPVKEMFYDELAEYFKEQAFLKFMDSGKKGLEQIAVDMIDNFAVQIRASGWNARASKFEWEDHPKEDNEKLITAATRYLIDGFIREGSSGFDGAIQYTYNMVSNYMASGRQSTMARSERKRMV